MTGIGRRRGHAAVQRAALPAPRLLATGPLATGPLATGLMMAALLVAGLLATGCGAAGAARSPSPTVTPAALTPSPAATPAAGSTGPASQPAATGPGPCHAEGLKVTVGPENGAAGSIYYPLDFINVSSVTCTMSGYPGVAFVTKAGGTAAGGTVLGAPAVRNPTFAQELVTLAPGATAHASLQVQVAQSYPAAMCKPVTAHWLQVYPPGSYAALYIPFTAVTCTGHIPSRSTLGIYVVQPGATGQ